MSKIKEEQTAISFLEFAHKKSISTYFENGKLVRIELHDRTNWSGTPSEFYKLFKAVTKQ